MSVNFKLSLSYQFLSKSLSKLNIMANQLIVSAQGKGQYISIGEAIADASSGDKILVRPGFYQENLAIDKELQIIGEGSIKEIILESLDLPTIQMQTERGLVRGLTIRKKGAFTHSFSISVAGFNPYETNDPIDRDKTAIHIPQGQLVVENCDITSESGNGNCILVEGQDANPIIRNCTIHNAVEMGVGFRYGARGVIENCDVFDIKGCGIWVIGGVPTVRLCTIHDNGNGVLIDQKGGGQFESCEIYNHSKSQVAILNASNPRFYKCKIHHGLMSGLVSDMDGLGIIEDSDIFSHQGDGCVKITRSGNPTIRRCKIHDGDEHGIFVAANGLGLIENCDIFDNAKSGIVTGQHSHPTIRNCRINHNGFEAVWSTQHSTGTVEDCDLTENLRGAFDIDSGCSLQRSRNRE